MEANPAANEQTSGSAMPAVSAANLLRTQLEKARKLLDSRPIPDDANKAWELITQQALIRIFGAASPLVSEFTRIGLGQSWSGDTEEDWENARAADLLKRSALLTGLIDLLENQADLILPGKADGKAPKKIHRVFLVHGHNNAFLQETARLIEKQGLTVTILRDEPNASRTIIEKFMDYSEVDFAVALLTADDRGGLSADAYEKQKPRARQNVILELGFFWGKLGRNKVCALCEAGVEIPSDYAGVVFVKLDPGGAWKYQLLREMKEAGIEIDLNLAG